MARIQTGFFLNLIDDVIGNGFNLSSRTTMADDKSITNSAFQPGKIKDKGVFSYFVSHRGGDCFYQNLPWVWLLLSWHEGRLVFYAKVIKYPDLFRSWV
ncbi:MAG: hypothetical protein NTW16_11515 [Bacteroidetes bacterium]|nr:hypothetical protein [Bacteroidota bacterium]